MVALKIYIDENLFFKDDDTHVFIETKNSVAIIKTINVFKDKLSITALGKHKLRPYSSSIIWMMKFLQTNLF